MIPPQRIYCCWNGTFFSLFTIKAKVLDSYVRVSFILLPSVKQSLLCIQKMNSAFRMLHPCDSVLWYFHKCTSSHCTRTSCWFSSLNTSYLECYLYRILSSSNLYCLQAQVRLQMRTGQDNFKSSDILIWIRNKEPDIKFSFYFPSETTYRSQHIGYRLRDKAVGSLSSLVSFTECWALKS